jgi:hypothetical protein
VAVGTRQQVADTLARLRARPIPAATR